MSSTTIAIAGGRTGGHLFPALAVAGSLMKLDENLNVYTIGTSDGMESRIMPEYGYEFHAVRAMPLRRSVSIRNLAIPFVLAIGVLQAFLLLRKKKTAAVFATGGFLCVPVLAAARLARVKIFMQEQNSYPGLTTRLFARHAVAIFAAYKVAEDYLHPDSSVIQTGNPLRPTFGVCDREEAMRHFGLDGSKKTLLVCGGSQGAESINKHIAENLGRIKENANVQLLWQTGRWAHDDYRMQFEESGVQGAVLPFIEKMDLAFACADLAISRAGAMTLSELAATQTPVILIPYPFAAENHQEYNARLFDEKGAAVLVKQSDMSESDMIGRALSLLDHDAALRNMAEAAGKLHSPDASDTIAKAILSEIDK